MTCACADQTIFDAAATVLAQSLRTILGGMNIFRILFGKKKPTASIPSKPVDAVQPNSAPVRASEPIEFPLHFRALLQTVARCDSIPELTEYLDERSGYIREVAIQRSLELGSPELLLPLAQRLNDWVPVVRRQARNAVMTLLPTMPILRLLEILPTVENLLLVERTDHTEWVKEFEGAFLRLVPVLEIVDGIKGTNVRVGRACFLLLQKHSLIDRLELIKLAMPSNGDIVLASHAIRMCADLSRTDLRETYLFALGCHVGSVRELALRGLLELEAAVKALPIAISALLDRQMSVRGAAISYLAAHGFDVRGRYRDILENEHSPKRTRIALISLASLRDAADIELIKRFVSAQVPVVRLAALTGWVRLAGADKDIVALTALRDPARSVRKFALHLVRRYGAYIPFPTLKSELQREGDHHLLLEFAQSNKWNWLECIAQLSLRIPSDDKLRMELTAALGDWLYRTNRSCERPSADQEQFFKSSSVVVCLKGLLSHDRVKSANLDLALAK